jgi:hypothetical protein
VATPAIASAPVSSSGVLTSVVPDVWITTAPVRIVGMHLTTTMTVLRLPGDGSLVLHSPIAMTPELRAAVEALGQVAHLYAPNTFHHLWIAEWASAFPSAKLHAPAALAKKRPDLKIDRAHDTAREPAFEGVLDELHVDGFFLEESVLVHHAARTLVVADLVHNIGRPPGLWTRTYSSMMGFYDQVALSRVIRWTAFSDRAAARKSVDAILERSFDRIVVGHGAPITSDAKAGLATAYGWLPGAR